MPLAPSATNSKVKKPNPKFDLARWAVGNLIDPDKVNWPREIKCFYKLLKKYPEPEFWKSFEPHHSRLPFAFYMSNGGKIYLDDKYNKFLLEKNSANAYNEEMEKPKSLQEFFKENLLEEFK